MYQEVLLPSSTAAVEKGTKTGPRGTYVPGEERHTISRIQDARR